MSQKPRHPEKVNKPINPIKKKPEWIRSKIVDSQIFFQTKKVVNQNNFCLLYTSPSPRDRQKTRMPSSA